MKMRVKTLEDAATWADLKGVDYALFRDGGEWTMQLRFSDCNGTYSEYITLPDKAAEGSLERLLDRACVETHRRRMGVVAYGKAG